MLFGNNGLLLNLLLTGESTVSCTSRDLSLTLSWILARYPCLRCLNFMPPQTEWGAETLDKRQLQILNYLKILEERISILELGGAANGSNVANNPVERVRTHAASCSSAQYKWVAPGYYNVPLERRAELIGCKPEQMMKAMVFLNSKCPQEDCSDPLDSRYYLVLVQYIAKVNVKKLEEAVRNLKPPNERLPAARFKFRLAENESGLSLTDFPKNGVSPFGCLSPVPIIISAASTKCRYLWMGAGHPWLKIGATTSELLKALCPIAVADVSDPRGEGWDSD